MNRPFLAVPCAPCGRAGVWWVGGDYVLHQLTDGTTWACPLPPPDVDRLTARQRAALDAAIRFELARRAEEATRRAQEAAA